MSPERSLPDNTLMIGNDSPENGALVSAPKPLVKTERMLDIKAKFGLEGEDVKDILERMYAQEKKSMGQIGQDLGLKQSLVNSYMKKLLPDLPRRKPGEYWQDPIHKEHRVSRMAESWSHPEAKKRRQSKMHSVEADAKRVRKTKEKWARNPEKKQAMVERTQQGISQAKIKRITSALGEDPKTTLEVMLYVERCNLEDVSERTGRSVGTLTRWSRELGVDIDPRRRTEKLDFDLKRARTEQKKRFG